ncbi:lactonase family protein [Roseomonas sp. SG15]|uniref:Lactonase family protein n=2 Tax=Roseomonas indoligenes TaxID=2820811 RepID=A0A940N099_9PROT|nr:lactonase family protein [Pararoseomonas indoligenes]
MAASLPASAALAQPASGGAPRGAGFAYVGSFTTEQRKARGDGINVYSIDAGTGAWRHVQRLGDLTNPSFLILSADGRFLYSVHGDLDYATAYAVDAATGEIRVLNRAATGGRNGVRQAIDPSGRFMVVANYASGSVAVLPLRPDGGLSDQHQLLPLEGTNGPHRAEQASSHPHDVVFDPTGRHVIIPDKGLDRVFVFRFDPQAGKLTPVSSVASRTGAGPRHLAFHPRLPVAWVLNELDSSVATYRWDAAAGTLTPMQVLTTLPATFFGASVAAEIAVTPDGAYVYCSNRGDDSVAAFAADSGTGALTPAGWTSTGGRDPRFIAVDPTGRFLLAANEQGDTIVPFRLDGANGRLSPNGPPIRNGSPVTIAFSTTRS